MNKNKKNVAKLVVTSKTAGSGAKVTSNEVFYIENKKYSIEHNKIRPDFFSFARVSNWSF